ncbi:unnamed protein product [Schistocephalus solidus]|uniref:EF-hand domain-containing protein n=1 Tax=Schistocephalus solidus TaxID=70667 RepID=A0A183SSF0_SCHSO|nr:unnamed protein product [Schistocephalus solidus]
MKSFFDKLKPKKQSDDDQKPELSPVVLSKSDGFLYDKPLPATTSNATIIDARSPDYNKLAKPSIRPIGPKRPPYKSQATTKPISASVARTGATLAEKAKASDAPRASQLEVKEETSASAESAVRTDDNNPPNGLPPSVSDVDGKQLDTSILQAATSKDVRPSIAITSETLSKQEELTTPLVQSMDAKDPVPTTLGTAPSLPPSPAPVPVHLSSGREQLFAAKLKDLNIGQSGFITFPEFLQLCPRVGLDEETYKASF